jgi:hypothetical protein
LIKGITKRNIEAVIKKAERLLKQSRRTVGKHTIAEVALPFTSTVTQPPLIAKSGFREYYNPLTGEGFGARNFGWSTLLIDMIRTQQKVSNSA